jgi:hypothetical protein
MTEPAGSFDGGTGTDVGTGDNSSPVNTPDSTQSQESSYNPAWDGVYGKLPQEFHNMIRPTLETWDRNYQSLQEQYEPWKQLGDYEQVSRNNMLVQQMNENPQAFYERLGQLIGVTPNQAQQIAQNGNAGGQEAQQSQGMYGTGEEDYLVDPEVAQLKQTVTQLQEQNQRWEAERVEAERAKSVADYQAKADAHIQRLATQHQTSYPTIPFNPQEVVQRVLLQTYQNPGKEPDIDQAYKDYLSLVTSVHTPPVAPGRSGPPAPSVINPNGGGLPPSDRVDMATATPEQRKAAVANFLAQRNSNQ